MRTLPQHLFGFGRPVTAGERLHLRLFEGAVALLAVHLAWSWGLYILRISDVVLPLGIARYVDVSFMFGNALPLVNAGLITAGLALGWLRVARWAYVGAFALLVLQYAARYCLGEIPHSSNLVGMCVLGFALAAACFTDEAHRQRFAFGFSVFSTGLGYSLAGVCKLIGTGVHWSDGRHLWMWVHEKSIDSAAKFGELDLNALQTLVLEHQALATAFLTIGLVSELGAVLMWWRPTRWPATLAVLGLHVGIYLIMGILFWAAMIVVTLVGLPWGAAFDALHRRTASDGAASGGASTASARVAPG